MSEPAPAPAIRRRRGEPWFGLAVLTVVLFGVWSAQAVLLPVVVAVLLALLLRPVVVALGRLRLPEAAAAAVVVATVLGAVAVAVLHLNQPARDWLRMSMADLRIVKERLAALRAPVEAVKGATERVADIAAGEPEGRPAVVVARSDWIATLGRTRGAVVAIASTVILLYFLLAAGDLFLRKLVRVLPRLRDKVVAVEITRTIQHEIGGYFVTVTAINIGLGCVTALVLWLIGLPNPAMWGVLVAIANFVPYLGPLAALAALTLASLIAFDDWQRMAAAPAAFLLLTSLEGQVVQPLLLGKRLAMNPVVIFLAVLAGGALWGIGGVFVAVPMLVVVKICAEHIPPWRPLAEFLSAD